MNRLAHGAVAGLAASVPMTLVFLAGRAAGLLRIPPPAQIAAAAAAEAGARDAPDGPGFDAAWLGLHLAFGAAAGALFAAVRPALPRASGAAGLAYGAAVWVAAYGGVMPALGLYPPVARDRPARAAVTAAAHATYGWALAAVADRAGERGWG